MSDVMATKTPKIWLLAAICGVLAFLALLLLAGYSVGASIIVGALVVFLVAILLWIGWYDDATDEHVTPAAPASTVPSAAEVAGLMPAHSDKSSAEAAMQRVTDAVRAEQAAPAPVEVAASEATPTKPAGLLDAPREGRADDLKEIKGIGPKMETDLNEIGIYHFDQIAALTAEERAWLDSRLKFKGRFERDDWAGQAAALARGGKEDN